MQMRNNCPVQIIEMTSFDENRQERYHRGICIARANFGKLLRRVQDERRSLAIEKRGTPKAVLLSIRDYVRLAAPEPEVLRVIGGESRRKGTDKLTAPQIDKVIASARAKKRKRG